MKNLLVIKGILATVAPLSIKMPDGSPNAYGNFPVMPAGVNGMGEPVLTGYLPATTLRGRLRREVVIRQMEKAAAAGKPYTLRQTYAELIGQDSESEKSADEVDLLAIKKARESSAIIDLFGSGLGVKSRLRVGHFTPGVATLPMLFCFPRKDLGDTDGVVGFLSVGDQEAFVNRSTTNSRRAAADGVVTDLKRKIRSAEKKQEAKEVIDGLRAQLGVAEAAALCLKDAMGDMANSSRTLVSHWALPIGTELKGRIVVENWKDRDIELLSYALGQLSLDPTLGAQRARGCGELKGTFDFYAAGNLIKRVAIGDYEDARVADFKVAAA